MLVHPIRDPRTHVGVCAISDRSHSLAQVGCYEFLIF